MPPLLLCVLLLRYISNNIRITQSTFSQRSVTFIFTLATVPNKISSTTVSGAFATIHMSELRSLRHLPSNTSIYSMSVFLIIYVFPVRYHDWHYYFDNIKISYLVD